MNCVIFISTLFPWLFLCIVYVLNSIEQEKSVAVLTIMELCRLASGAPCFIKLTLSAWFKTIFLKKIIQPSLVSSHPGIYCSFIQFGYLKFSTLVSPTLDNNPNTRTNSPSLPLSTPAELKWLVTDLYSLCAGSAIIT